MGSPHLGLIQLGPRTPALCRSFDLGGQPLCSDLPDLIVDTLPLAPPDIEERFGISGGHIHHVDNTVAFDERVPHAWPVPGLYSASAGCHPAGSVIGAAGHNAAVRVLQDLGKSLVGTGLSE